MLNEYLIFHMTTVDIYKSSKRSSHLILLIINKVNRFDLPNLGIPISNVGRGGWNKYK